MTSHPAAPFTTLTARSPEDLLAVVPVVLGFHPRESVVMLTLASGRSFHARADLPPPGAGVDDLAEVLVHPVLAHRVSCVAFVLYTGDRSRADLVARTLRRRFARARVEVRVVLRAHDGRWWLAPAHDPEASGPGVPYDISAHPFLAQAVVDGRVTHPSRDELAATCAAEPHLVDAVDAVLAGVESGLGELGPVARTAWRTARLAAVWRLLDAPDDLGVDDAAELLAAAADEEVREAVVRSFDRGRARQHVELWSRLLRRSPRRYLAPVGFLVAWSAWQAGDGALAWCALDRAAEADGDERLDPLLQLMAQVLSEAVPPWSVDRHGTSRRRAVGA